MITELFNNVFHSFWTFAGTAILLGILTEGVTRLFTALVIIVRGR